VSRMSVNLRRMSTVTRHIPVRRLGFAAVVAAVLALSADRWVATTELPNLSPQVSQTVLDRQGRLLRAYTVVDGRWRLPVDVSDVDPGYLAWRG